MGKSQSIADVAKWAEQRAAIRPEKPAKHRDLGRMCDHPLAKLHSGGTLTEAELDAGIEIALWLESETIPGGKGAMPVFDPSRVVVDGGGPASTDLRTVRVAGVRGDVVQWRAWADRQSLKGRGAGEIAMAVCAGIAVGKLREVLGVRNGVIGGVVASALRGYATEAYRERSKRA
jgi:hypothetical protein